MMQCIIFDRDKHGTFSKALQNIKTLSGQKRKSNRVPIIAIVSNPCIEIWIMCHFEMPKQTYCESSKSVKSALKKYLPGYDENDPSIFQKIACKQMQAIKNAKVLISQNTDPLQKPFTNVHELVESL